MLLWKELRDLAPRCLMGLAVVFAWLWLESLWTHTYDLSETVRVCLAKAAVSARSPQVQGYLYWATWFFGAWATVLGFDVLAGERADRTWMFLRSRPVRASNLLGTKLAPRLALVTIPFLSCWAAVIAYARWGAPVPDFPAEAYAHTLAHAWYVISSPPYPVLHAIAWATAQLVFCFAVAVLVGSLWAHRGIALGAALVANLLLWSGEAWLLDDAMARILNDWQAPGAAFYVVWIIALATAGWAAYYIATVRQPKVLGSP